MNSGFTQCFFRPQAFHHVLETLLRAPRDDSARRRLRDAPSGRHEFRRQATRRQIEHDQLRSGLRAGGDEYEEHGHTLSALQGRGLRRELSTMVRGVDGFDGEDALDAGGVSPDHPHQ